MKKILRWYVICAVIYACHEPPEISPILLECPQDITFIIHTPVVASQFLPLPVPAGTTTCSNPELQFVSNIPSELEPKSYDISIEAKDACGAKSVCNYRLTIIYEELPEVSTIQLECPQDITLEITTPLILAQALHLPDPVATTSCSNPELNFNSNLPDELTAGTYQVKVGVHDECGSKDSCTYSLTLENVYDYRDKFLGTYMGIRSCGWFNPDTLVFKPDTMITLSILKGSKFNTIIVLEDDDEVIIDTTGTFPYPSFGGYRFYRLNFSNDSLCISQSWGTVASQSSCSFRGRKN